MCSTERFVIVWKLTKIHIDRLANTWPFLPFLNFNLLFERKKQRHTLTQKEAAILSSLNNDLIKFPDITTVKPIFRKYSGCYVTGQTEIGNQTEKSIICFIINNH